MENGLNITNRLDNLNLTRAETGENIVNQIVKDSVFDGKIEKAEVIEKDGKAKLGFEIFDLNGDEKVDNLEWDYFSSGGKIHRKETNEVTAREFLDSINKIDAFGSIWGMDGKISDEEKKKLYKVIEVGHYFEENIGKISAAVKKEYMDVLDDNELEILGDNNACNNTIAGLMHSFDSKGQTIDLKLNFQKLDEDKKEASMSLIHELTHVIRIKKGRMPEIKEEAQAFYMEALFREKIKNEAVIGDLPSGRVLYDEFEKINKDTSLTKGQVATQIFLKDEHLKNFYKDFYGLTDEKVDEIFKNTDYLPIGDIDFSKS